MFEPACGCGNITRIIREQLNIDVVEPDLFTREDKIDYLHSEDPLYCFLITNPPFVSKFEFLKKAFESGKPFAMLSPFQCFYSKRSGNV